MEALRGRDAVGGSMRSMTARPAILLGRGRAASIGLNYSAKPMTTIAFWNESWERHASALYYVDLAWPTRFP